MAQKPVKYYLVDAFTDSAFKGNPAAVCLLEEERDEAWMLSIAGEFNISMTAFLTRVTESSDSKFHINNGSNVPRFRLRWFTSVTEFKLCGHATIAASHVLFSTGLVKSNTVEYYTLSGILTAKRIPLDKETEKFSIELNFPAIQTAVYESVEVSSINNASANDWKTATDDDDIIIVLPSCTDVVNFKPNLDELRKYPGRGVIITGASPDSEFDFYSRFFFPKNGIPEDPVCGSAHCSLGPYWSKKLGKNDFVAYSASARGGKIDVHLDEENQRVLLKSQGVIVMEGFILI